ncbi:lipopolysaccharide biosynthesis protein [Pantoea sp. PSNIH1]|uniref:lipopolysaccharide biosynthesis protein n=1 Tax=Pantoea sp. PSNIH1 TaxID=1484158 RepID=UPI00119E455C|nr:oligosaccharide flippase family protein [Pantoea sp. PSNIH1]
MSKDIRSLAYIYSVRIYTSIVSIVLIPHLINAVGLQAYGLVGFFSVLIACLSVLDAGIGGVLTRESIISKKSFEGYCNFLKVYRKLILFFFVISIIVSISGFYISREYGNTWLNSSLDKETVSTCLTIMFCIFSLRYMQGPFRSILLSCESQITITTLNLIYTTISQPVSLILLILLNKGIVFFFTIQLLAALITTMLYYIFSKRANKKVLIILDNENSVSAVKKTSLRKMLYFAFQLSSLSLLWVAVNQSDKLTLSKYMNLGEYGIYSVALSIIGILAILSDPINQYLQPRLTKCYFEKDYLNFSRFYFNSLTFIIIITIPLSSMFFVYSKQIVLLWSNSMTLSEKVSQYLPWLFIGGISAIFSNFIFLLLYSIGRLKAHTYIYALFAVLVIPANVYIAKIYLGAGTSKFFAINTTMLFILWGGYNLNKYFSYGAKIIYLVMLPLAIMQYFLMSAINKLSLLGQGRVADFFILLCIGLFGLAVSYLYVRFVSNILPNYRFRER